MADRRSLKNAMTLTPEKVAFIHGSTDKPAQAMADQGTAAAAMGIEAEPSSLAALTATISPRRRRTRRSAVHDAQPQASEILDQVLVPVTIRLTYRTAQALKRAALEQQLKHLKPDLVQDIGEQAIAAWLANRGYLR